MSKSARIGLIAMALAMGSSLFSPSGAQTQPCEIQPSQLESVPLTCANVYDILSLDSAVTPLQEVLVYKIEPTTGDSLGTRLLPDADESILPGQILETRVNARAEMQFNEGSLAWLDQRTQFTFQQGIRQVQLVQGSLLVMTTTEEDVASQPLEIVTIGADAGTTIAEIEIPGTGVFVQHSGAITSVFMLTDHPDNPVTIARATNIDEEPEMVQLRGGEMVSVTESSMSDVMEFDVVNFYRTNPLASILGPGAVAEAGVAQRPASVQTTLTEVRNEALAVVNAQNAGFRRSFLSEALTGDGDGLLYGDGDSDVNRDAIRRMQVFDSEMGVFVITNEDTGEGVFRINGTNIEIPIQVDIDNAVVTIDGQSGQASFYGLRGNNAAATVILDNGEVLRVEVFDVNGQLPNAGVEVPGIFQTGTIPESLPDY